MVTAIYDVETYSGTIPYLVSSDSSHHLIEVQAPTTIQLKFDNEGPLFSVAFHY